MNIFFIFFLLIINIGMICYAPTVTVERAPLERKPIELTDIQQEAKISSQSLELKTPKLTEAQKVQTRSRPELKGEAKTESAPKTSPIEYVKKAQEYLQRTMQDFLYERGVTKETSLPTIERGEVKAQAPERAEQTKTAPRLIELWEPPSEKTQSVASQSKMSSESQEIENRLANTIKQYATNIKSMEEIQRNKNLPFLDAETLSTLKINYEGSRKNALIARSAEHFKEMTTNYLDILEGERYRGLQSKESLLQDANEFLDFLSFNKSTIDSMDPQTKKQFNQQVHTYLKNFRENVLPTY